MSPCRNPRHEIPSGLLVVCAGLLSGHQPPHLPVPAAPPATVRQQSQRPQQSLPRLSLFILCPDVSDPQSVGETSHQQDESHEPGDGVRPQPPPPPCGHPLGDLPGGGGAGGTAAAVHQRRMFGAARVKHAFQLHIRQHFCFHQYRFIQTVVTKMLKTKECV